MSMKLRKFNKLLIPTLVVSGALPFVAAQCDKKSKNEPQTKAQKIESAKTKIKELLKILQTNKTKYVSKTYEELSKNVEQIVSKINATLNKQNVNLNELAQLEKEVKQEIARLENIYNKLKNEREEIIAKYEKTKNLLISFFNLLTSKPIEGILDFSTDKTKVESITNDADKLIKDNNFLNQQISEKVSLLEQQIAQINEKVHAEYNEFKMKVQNKMGLLVDNAYTDIKKQIEEIFNNESKNASLPSFYENIYYSLSVKFKELLEEEKKHFDPTKIELINLVTEATLLKKQVNTKFPNVSTTNLETAINKAKTEINNVNATEESIATAKSDIHKEISSIKVVIAKEELGKAIEHVEAEYSKIKEDKFYKSLKDTLKKVIDEIKGIQGQANKTEDDYKKALDKLKSSLELTKTKEKKISDFVQSITKSIDECEKILKEKENKKFFENKAKELKNQFSSKKTEYESENFGTLTVDALINKLEESKEKFEDLHLMIEAEFKQLKDDYDEYLDEWKKTFDAIKKFEKRIENVANKEELMKMYNTSDEYNNFKDEATIKGYNISSRDELLRITKKVDADLYNAQKKFTKEEINRLLNEFETIGKAHSNEEYKQIEFNVQGRNKMKYEQLKKFMETFDDYLYIINALLEEVEQKLSEYKIKLNHTS
ncbi:Uncharacterised protein [Mycoplasmopsis caviae]|uniref:Lipoprotein n=2 Tax=Mycoplasmopsis caviae TaxID=55603 RepID=A0A3P8MDK7_9BACT|nr:Uncharacterised protein [Mycoplasmopsis caviae]